MKESFNIYETPSPPKIQSKQDSNINLYGNGDTGSMRQINPSQMVSSMVQSDGSLYISRSPQPNMSQTISSSQKRKDPIGHNQNKINIYEVKELQKKKKEPLHIALYKKINLLEQEMAVKEEQRKKPQINIGPTYLYDKAMQRLQRREDLKSKLTEEVYKKDMEECTFKPNINPQSERIQKKSYVDLLLKTANFMMKQQNTIKDSQQIKLDQELSQCTFSPQIIKYYPIPSQQRSVSTYDRMQIWLRQLNERQEQKKIQIYERLRASPEKIQKNSCHQSTSSNELMTSKLISHQNISQHYLGFQNAITQNNQVQSRIMDSSMQSPVKTINSFQQIRESINDPIDTEIVQTVQLLKSYSKSVKTQSTKMIGESRLKTTMRQQPIYTSRIRQPQKQVLNNPLKRSLDKLRVSMEFFINHSQTQNYLGFQDIREYRPLSTVLGQQQ